MSKNIEGLVCVGVGAAIGTGIVAIGAAPLVIVGAGMYGCFKLFIKMGGTNPSTYNDCECVENDSLVGRMIGR